MVEIFYDLMIIKNENDHGQMKCIKDYLIAPETAAVKEVGDSEGSVPKKQE